MTKKQSYSTSETFTQIQWIWKNPDAWLLQMMIDHNYISYFDQKEETKSKLKIVKRTGSGSATKIAFSDDSLLSLHDSAWGTSLMIPFWSIVLFHIADHQGPEWHWKMTLQNAWHCLHNFPSKVWQERFVNPRNHPRFTKKIPYAFRYASFENLWLQQENPWGTRQQKSTQSTSKVP